MNVFFLGSKVMTLPFWLLQENTLTHLKSWLSIFLIHLWTPSHFPVTSHWDETWLCFKPLLSSTLNKGTWPQSRRRLCHPTDSQSAHPSGTLPHLEGPQKWGRNNTCENLLLFLTSGRRPSIWCLSSWCSDGSSSTSSVTYKKIFF